MINPSEKLLLHYYFNDDTSHSMNATLRHDCEHEILLIIKELLTSFDTEAEIESEAFLDGGLKNLWKLIGKNNPQITLILLVITIMLSRVPVENKELVNLQIQNLKLDNELKQQELRKLKQEIKTDADVTDSIVELVIEKLENNYKLLWHKSNFYKKLNFYSKVKKVSTQLLDNNNRPTDEERIVFRNQFASLIIHSDQFPPLIDKEAVIAIISPVLTKGKFLWKGLYKGEIINFEMKDKDFKSAVLSKQVEFVNGIAIRCILQQNRKIDELGVIQITHSDVQTVLDIIESDKTFETEQGRRYKKAQIEKSKQIKLF